MNPAMDIDIKTYDGLIDEVRDEFNGNVPDNITMSASTKMLAHSHPGLITDEIQQDLKESYPGPEDGQSRQLYLVKMDVNGEQVGAFAYLSGEEAANFRDGDFLDDLKDREIDPDQTGFSIEVPAKEPGQTEPSADSPGTEQSAPNNEAQPVPESAASLSLETMKHIDDQIEPGAVKKFTLNDLEVNPLDMTPEELSVLQQQNGFEDFRMPVKYDIDIENLDGSHQTLQGTAYLNQEQVHHLEAAGHNGSYIGMEGEDMLPNDTVDLSLDLEEAAREQQLEESLEALQSDESVLSPPPGMEGQRPTVDTGPGLN